MAIRRCPYCKAIIDEQDKYCNNCGTQLLFPEDEFVEEEIPGDKILDKDEPEPAETGDTDEGRERATGLEEEPSEEDEDENEQADEDEPAGEPGLGAADDDDHEDDKDEDEDEDEDDDAEDIEKDEDVKAEDKDEQEDDDEDDDDEDDEDDLEAEDEDEDSIRAGAPGTGAGQREDTGSSAELEEETDGEDEEAEEDVDAIAGEDDRGRDDDETGEDDDLNGLAEVGREAEPSDEPDKKYEVSIEDDELVIKTKAVPDTASLPPWANRIRETPATVGSEEGTRETSPLSREWTTDSGIGIPERVTQAALPFSDTGTQEVRPPAQETDHVEDETREATAEVEEAGPAGGLSLKLRAKFVDWVFVTALWVISLWFTAQVVGVSFFRLLFGSPLQVLAFYLILLVLYFFLFLYFLGETLGDHYFSE